MPGAAKAWVNFNGTGTVAIRAQFNVSSITDNGTGDYTVNFTTAMPDANYSSAGMAGVNDTSANANVFVASYTQLSGSLRTRVWAQSTVVDFNNVAIAVFR
jgi:hypothetical protein